MKELGSGSSSENSNNAGLKMWERTTKPFMPAKPQETTGDGQRSWA
jgi:hypothetical protein